MKRSIEDSLVDILKNRIVIWRDTKIINLGELAKEWKVSKITIYRYVDQNYREMSRESARKQTIMEKKHDKSKCFKCKKNLKDHARCGVCSILLHSGKICWHPVKSV